jgi:LPS-assembly lipoprotein
MQQQLPPFPTLPHNGGGRTLRRGLALSLALLTAGCFQPLYGDPHVVPTAGLDDKLQTVEVAPIDAPVGSHIARVAVEVRNSLLTDTSTSGRKRYQLKIQLTANQQQVIVDINTARPDIQNYGLDAVYTLTDLATNKPVFRASTFARVSYNIPGQQQRFSGERGLRDAENRAAQTIADNIRSRLASYLVAGT